MRWLALTLASTLAMACGGLAESPLADAGRGTMDDASAEASDDATAATQVAADAMPPVTPVTLACQFSTYESCCVTQDEGCPTPFWGLVAGCDAVTSWFQYYYTPCDGFLATNTGYVIELFDADGGKMVAQLHSNQGTEFCYMGPPAGVTVSQACLDLWTSGAGTGATSGCVPGDAGSLPSDICSYLFPNGP